MATRTKSAAPVAARETLNEQQGNAGSGPDLESTAKEQEKTQRDELSQSPPKFAKAAEKLREIGPAAERAGHGGETATVLGKMDNMSRRSGGDALEGHFVSLDLNDKDVQAAYKQAGLEGHTGDYGVYLEPAALEPGSGVPTAIIVRLRDASNARVVVPYEAARPAEARGR